MDAVSESNRTVADVSVSNQAASSVSQRRKAAKTLLTEGAWLVRGEQYGLLIILGGLLILFTFWDSGLFMTAANWTSIGLNQSVLAILALGVLFPLITGHFDLSIGSNAIACSVLCAGCSARYHLPLAAGVIVTIAFGLLVGGVNGFLVTVGRLNGLIATIGVATVLEAIVYWYTNNLPTANGIWPDLLNFGVGSVAGFPYVAIAAAVLMVVTYYTHTQTPFGRKLTAIGSNAAAARLVGIRVTQLTLASYLVAGFLGSIAGIMMLAYQGSSNPSQSGISLLISALTIVFLGAACIRPGEFNVPGLLIALLLTAVLISGLTLKGVANWVSPLSYGVALIVGVGMSAYFRARHVG
jgi:Ribose/xylose/arabinose/galactoside ABC-type transport systems, permease components